MGYNLGHNPGRQDKCSYNIRTPLPSVSNFWVESQLPVWRYFFIRRDTYTLSTPATSPFRLWPIDPSPFPNVRWADSTSPFRPLSPSLRHLSAIVFSATTFYVPLTPEEKSTRLSRVKKVSLKRKRLIFLPL